MSKEFIEKRFGACKVLISVDDGRRHLSISHAIRYPTWDEIRDAKNKFIGEDVCMVMVLPKKELYVNICKNCFHLWELLPGESNLSEYM